MIHQAVGCQLLAENPEFYFLACEQGTGKTWMVMADAERQLGDGRIGAMFVLAPKGVHINWTRREIPKHMSVPVRAAHYSAGASRKAKNEIEKLFRPRQDDELIVLSMNIDAINFAEGYALAARFLRHYRCMFVVDESGRIKNPTAKRTAKAVKLGKLAVSRRCASGTPITQSPADIFSQFEFLAPGQAVLGTDSYRAFVAEYAELLPDSHATMRNIRRQAEARARANGRVARPEEYAAQIIRRDERGLPVYKNLKKLNGLLKPHMYRVLKKDALPDLPAKIYTTRYFELGAAQRRIYDFVDEELRIELNGELETFTALTKQVKLQQLTSGFIIKAGDVFTLGGDGEEDTTTSELIPRKENPRMDLLREVIEDVVGSFIIWARFRQEIVQTCELLTEMGISHVEYHGGIKPAARDDAIDALQAGTARCLVGNAQSAGIGLTLTRAETSIYFSQSANLEHRLQSEDRNHRIGTKNNVLYIDLCGVDTVDERVTGLLQNKQRVAHEILDADRITIEEHLRNRDAIEANESAPVQPALFDDAAEAALLRLLR